MMHYLGAIEARTNDILQMYQACKEKGGGDVEGAPTGMQVPKKGGDDKANIEAPDVLSLNDVEERKEEDDETRKLTIKDFKQKAQEVRFSFYFPSSWRRRKWPVGKMRGRKEPERRERNELIKVKAGVIRQCQ